MLLLCATFSARGTDKFQQFFELWLPNTVSLPIVSEEKIFMKTR